MQNSNQVIIQTNKNLEKYSTKAKYNNCLTTQQSMQPYKYIPKC